MNKSFSVFALLFFLCVAPLLQATVAPVTLGEGIWNVLTRVAFAASEIEGATGCYYFIRQANIPLTITQPGNYCLNESIVFSGTAVTINSSDVNFNMNGYSMDANFATNSVAFLLDSGDNISIANGLIQNTTRGAILSNSTPHRNIVISDIDIVQNLVGIVLNIGMNVEGLLIENCYFSNGGGITIQGSGVTVRGCKLDDSFTGTGSALISIRGLSDARLARHAIVEDCSITGSVAGDIQGITIQFAKNAIVNNCIVEGGGALNTGISFNNVSNLMCSNCLVDNVTNVGIRAITIAPFITPIDSVVIKNCIISESGSINLDVRTNGAELHNVLITDCVSTGGPNGGILVFAQGALMSNVTIQRCICVKAGLVSLLNGGIHLAESSGGLRNVVIKDCVAIENAIGYVIRGEFDLVGLNIDNVICSNCIANGNNGHGFFVNGQNENIIFDHCIAQSNITFGFDLVVTNSWVMFSNCCAEGNDSIGYINGAGAGAEAVNKCLACSSLGDAGGGFLNFDAALIKTGAAAVSAATYWNNVVF